MATVAGVCKECGKEILNPDIGTGFIYQCDCRFTGINHDVATPQPIKSKLTIWDMTSIDFDTADKIIEIALKVIDREPELEGEPPEQFKLIAEELRAAVRTTKKSIRKNFLEEVYKSGLTKKQY